MAGCEDCFDDGFEGVETGWDQPGGRGYGAGVFGVSRKGAKALRYKNNIAQLCRMRMNFEPALNDSISCIGSKF